MRATALTKLRPNAKWTMRGNVIEWEDEKQTQPTEEELDVKEAELQAEYDAQKYARRRKLEYNSLNQFELMTDDAANSTTTHADAIGVIKAKWPKDNSGEPEVVEEEEEEEFVAEDPPATS